MCVNTNITFMSSIFFHLQCDGRLREAFPKADFTRTWILQFRVVIMAREIQILTFLIMSHDQCPESILNLCDFVESWPVGFWSIVETFGTFVQLLTRPSWRPLVQEMVANAKIFEDQSGSKSRIVILITPGLFFVCFSSNMGLFCFRNIEFWTKILEFLIKNCWVLKFCWVNEDCLSFQWSVIWAFPLKISGIDQF